MTESPIQTVPKPQPLRLNIQCSLIIESPEEASALYEEIGTFVKGIQSTAVIGGSVMKLLGPCCGDKLKGVPNVQPPQKT